MRATWRADFSPFTFYSVDKTLKKTQETHARSRWISIFLATKRRWHTPNFNRQVVIDISADKESKQNHRLVNNTDKMSIRFCGGEVDCSVLLCSPAACYTKTHKKHQYIHGNQCIFCFCYTENNCFFFPVLSIEGSSFLAYFSLSPQRWYWMIKLI